jgi:DNA-directed RNA polymerase specialized sigma24 family protein
MTVRADLVEELINDTMFQVWKEGASIGANASVFLAIMRFAYFRVRKHCAEVRADEPHSQRDVKDREPSNRLLAAGTPSDLQLFLSRLSIEKRAVVHLVYASACSREEAADIMRIACDRVDVLLCDVRASAMLHFRGSNNWSE